MKRLALLRRSILFLSLLVLWACTDSESNFDSDIPVNKARAIAFTHMGATNGLFAVSDHSYVRFSRGNLQYQASSSLWRFASQQYEVVGPTNTQISATTSSWIDLFGWGTSGWNSGASCYRPYDNHPNSLYYTPQGDSEADLSSSQADWGVFNAILNGGGVANSWRTPTQKEWQYLFSNTTSQAYGRSNLWATATVGETPGIVLLPNRRCGADGEVYLWKLPSDLTFTPGQSAGWATNVYSLSQWEKLERCGAVFLPVAQLRNNSFITSSTIASTFVGITNGYYWSSTSATPTTAYALDLTADMKVQPMDRQYGLSVRLVADFVK